MNKFKIGDKVKCIDNKLVEDCLTKGNIYTIRKIVKYSECYGYGYFLEEVTNYSYNESYFELFEEFFKFPKEKIAPGLLSADYMYALKDIFSHLLNKYRSYRNKITKYEWKEKK
jgi:hypothetical protein